MAITVGSLLDKVLAGAPAALTVVLFLLIALPWIFRYLRKEVQTIVISKDETIRAKEETIQTKDTVIATLQQQLGVSNETWAKRIEQEQLKAQYAREAFEQKAGKYREEAEEAQGGLKKELEEKTKATQDLAEKAKSNQEQYQRISGEYRKTLAEMERLKQQVVDLERKQTGAYSFASVLGGGLMGGIQLEPQFAGLSPLSPLSLLGLDAAFKAAALGDKKKTSSSSGA